MKRPLYFNQEMSDDRLLIFCERPRVQSRNAQWFKRIRHIWLRRRHGKYNIYGQPSVTITRTLLCRCLRTREKGFSTPPASAEWKFVAVMTFSGTEEADDVRWIFHCSDVRGRPTRNSNRSKNIARFRERRERNKMKSITHDVGVNRSTTVGHRVKDD